MPRYLSKAHGNTVHTQTGSDSRTRHRVNEQVKRGKPTVAATRRHTGPRNHRTAWGSRTKAACRGTAGSCSASAAILITSVCSASPSSELEPTAGARRNPSGDDGLDCGPARRAHMVVLTPSPYTLKCASHRTWGAPQSQVRGELLAAAPTTAPSSPGDFPRGPGCNAAPLRPRSPRQPQRAHTPQPRPADRPLQARGVLANPRPPSNSAAAEPALPQWEHQPRPCHAGRHPVQ